MTTKLAGPLKRELDVGGQPYVLTITPEGLKLSQKGKRRGQEMAWSAFVSGDAALATALNASRQTPHGRPERRVTIDIVPRRRGAAGRSETRRSERMDSNNDCIAEIAPDYGTAVGLASDTERLTEATPIDLIAAAAVLTRTLIKASRLRLDEATRTTKVPSLIAARQAILAEMRRRTAVAPVMV